MGHQVVHGGGTVGGRAEEDRRVAKDLAQPGVLEAGRHVGAQAPQQLGPEDRQGAQDVRVGQGGRPAEVRVEEVVLGEPVDPGRGVEVGPQPAPGAGLEGLEQRLRVAGAHVHGGLVEVPLEVHPVAGVQAAQVQPFGGGGPHEAEPAVDHLGHQVPGGPGVEGEPRLGPASGTAAQDGAALQQRHPVPVAGQQARRGQSGEPAAHHHGARAESGVPGAHRRPPRRPRARTRAAIRAF